MRAIPFDSHTIASDEVNRRAVAMLEDMGVVKNGDRVLITKGNYNDAHGGTNTLRSWKWAATYSCRPCRCKAAWEWACLHQF